MEAFSMDLRQRVWDALNQRDQSGETIDEISERFQVSRQWIFKLRQRFAEEQTLDPKPHGGGQPRKVTEELEQCLCDKIAEQPDATLQELRDHCGIKGSLTAVWRALQRLGISLKKKRSRPRSENLPKSRLSAKNGCTNNLFWMRNACFSWTKRTPIPACIGPMGVVRLENECRTPFPIVTTSRPPCCR